MRPRIIQVIELEADGALRYYHADGRPLGVSAPVVSRVPEEPASVEDLLDMVPRKRRGPPPPFDPSDGPVMSPAVGGGDE